MAADLSWARQQVMESAWIIQDLAKLKVEGALRRAALPAWLLRLATRSQAGHNSTS